MRSLTDLPLMVKTKKNGSNFVIGNAIFPLKMNNYVVGNLCLEEEQLISYLTVCYNMLNLNLN